MGRYRGGYNDGEWSPNNPPAYDEYKGYLNIGFDGKADENGEVILFPSRALYEKYPLDAKKAWNEWAESRESKRWRAKDGQMFLHKIRPQRVLFAEGFPPEEDFYELPRDSFPSIKWESEPKRVKIEITLIDEKEE